VRADSEQEQRDERPEAPADEDHRPSPDMIRHVAADVAGEPGEHGAGQIRERQLALRGVQVLDRPDAHERIDGRAGDRPDEPDGEHGPKRRVDVTAPDEPEEPAEERHWR
jgi:hypothetical protein